MFSPKDNALRLSNEGGKNPARHIGPTSPRRSQDHPSSTKKLAIAAPSAVGMFIAGQRIYGNKSITADVVTRVSTRTKEIMSPAETVAQGFAKTAEDFTAKTEQAFIESQLTVLRGWQSSELGKDMSHPGVVKEAWKMASLRGDPLGAFQRAAFLEKEDPFGAVIAHLEGLQGKRVPASQVRTIRRFMQRFTGIADYLKAGGAIADISQPIDAFSPILGGATSYTPHFKNLASAEALPETWRSGLTQLEKVFGGTFNVSLAERKGAMGGLYKFEMQHSTLLANKGFRSEGLKFYLPRTLMAEAASGRLDFASTLAESMVSTGMSNQSTRVPGQFISVASGEIRHQANFPEFVLAQLPELFGKGVRESRTPRQFRRYVKDVMAKFGEYGRLEQGYGADVHGGARAQVYLAAHDLHVFSGTEENPWARPATSAELAEVIRNSGGSLHPAPAPKRMLGDLMHNRPPIVRALDPSELFFGGPAAIARSPWQAVNKGRIMSPAAIAYMQSNVPISETTSVGDYHVRTEWQVTPLQKRMFGTTDIAPRFRRAYILGGPESLKVGEGLRSHLLTPAFESSVYDAKYLEYSDTFNAVLRAQAVDQTGPGMFNFKTPLTIGDPALPGLAEDRMLGIIASGAGEGGPLKLNRGDTLLGWEYIGSKEGETGAEGPVKQTIRLRYHKLEEAQSSAKRYGGVKEQSGEVADAEIQRIYREARGGSALHHRDVMAAAHLDAMKKNRSRLLQEMFGSLVEETRDIMDRGALRNSPGLKHAQRLLADPTGVYKGFMQIAMRGENEVAQRALRGGTDVGAAISDAAIGQAWNYAKAMQLPAPVMGELFGALPHTWGIGEGQLPAGDAAKLVGRISEKTHGQLKRAYGIQAEFVRRGLAEPSIPEAMQIARNVFVGSSTSYAGTPMELTGAGNLGSLEPRAFQLWQGPHFGQFGKDLSNEFLRRGMMAEPELMREQQLLGGALLELEKTKHDVSFGDLPTYKLSELEAEAINPRSPSFIGHKGAIVDMEGVGGVGRLVMPSPEDVPSLAPTGEISGEVYQKSLAKNYADFLETARNVKLGKSSSTEMTEATEDFHKQLYSAYEGTLTAKGRGLASTKVKGSRYFTYSSFEGTGKEATHPLEAWIPEGHARDMFSEMEELYGKEAMSEIKERAFHGEAVGGVSWRHPLFGPYSAPPVRMRVMRGIDEPRVFVPIKNVEAFSEGKSLGMFDLGIMPGQMADMDADIGAFSLLPPKLEQAAMSHTELGSQWVKQYHEWSLQDQIMKSLLKTGPGVSISDIDKVMDEGFEQTEDYLRKKYTESEIADLQKLAIPQQSVGKVSTALSEARAAVLTSSISRQSKFNLMSMFNQMEQAPVWGKHLAAGNIEALQTKFEQITSSVSKGGVEGAKEFMGLFKGIFGSSSEGARVFGEGIPIQAGDINTTLKIDEGLAQDFAQATSEFRRAGIGGTSARDIWSIRRKAGRGKPFRMEAGTASRLMGAADPFLGEARLPLRKSGLGATLSTLAGALANEASNLGGKAWKVASKPLAWGFGASIGLAMLLSKPTSTLDPGASAPPPPMRPTSPESTGIPPESLAPDGQVIGNPSTPAYPGPGTSRIAPPGKYPSRIRAVGTAPGQADYDDIQRRIMQRIGRAGRGDTRVLDRRTSLSDQKVSDMIV